MFSDDAPIKHLAGAMPKSRFSVRILLFAVLVIVVMVSIFAIQNSGNREAPKLTGGMAMERTTLSSDGFLANSKFVVTKASLSYDVNTKPSCWTRHCDQVNNWLAFSPCEGVALEWNSLGVRSMERYVSSSPNMIEGLGDTLLSDALAQFGNASKAAEQKCWTPLFNAALVATKLRLYSLANTYYEQALELAKDKEFQAITHLHWGLALELEGKGERFRHYEQALALDNAIEKDYFGVAISSGGKKQLSNTGAQQAPVALLDYLLYKHFASVSMARYALLTPGTQDSFIENRYAIIKNVLPPFVLKAVQKCFNDMISAKLLRFNDGQADRYVSYNDRCARFLHYQLSDLIRTIIAHNAIPSYTYFGGYKGGSVLKPHTDRAACEFTMSLTIQQSPHDKPWTLSASKIALFEKDANWRGRNPEKLPSEEDTVNADLLSGDALLFMGRHLVHWRKGALPEGHWTNQVFMHFVQEDFTGELA